MMDNVKVMMGGVGFLITKEEIEDGVAERVLIERYRNLIQDARAEIDRVTGFDRFRAVGR